MEAAAIVGLIAVAVVIAIVLMCAFNLVNALTPQFNLALLAIVGLVAVFAIFLMALAFKNRD